jgi:hypothetical protein
VGDRAFLSGSGFFFFFSGVKFRQNVKKKKKKEKYSLIIMPFFPEKQFPIFK